jgi:hypothetical protein
MPPKKHKKHKKRTQFSKKIYFNMSRHSASYDDFDYDSYDDDEEEESKEEEKKFELPKGGFGMWKVHVRGSYFIVNWGMRLNWTGTVIAKNSHDAILKLLALFKKEYVGEIGEKQVESVSSQIKRGVFFIGEEESNVQDKDD